MKAVAAWLGPVEGESLVELSGPHMRYLSDVIRLKVAAIARASTLEGEHFERQPTTAFRDCGLLALEDIFTETSSKGSLTFRFDIVAVQTHAHAYRLDLVTTQRSFDPRIATVIRHFCPDQRV